nr:MAG TPA: hypothetical protein [Caudoviricetes sp.]DAK00870.1 MAG TPA: hypothetical protein [Caudoviricetes sp.]
MLFSYNQLLYNLFLFGTGCVYPPLHAMEMYGSPLYR